MSELLLQTIIEKLEALEIGLLKPDASHNKAAMTAAITEGLKQMRSEREVFSPDINLINDNIFELRKMLSEYRLNSPQALSTRIEHRHHLHKGIWISVGMLMLAIILSYAWFYTYQNKKVFEANDIKYRALKITGSKPLLELLQNTDSLFDLNKAAFHEYVVAKEQQFKKQAEILRLAIEKKKEK